MFYEKLKNHFYTDFSFTLKGRNNHFLFTINLIYILLEIKISITSILSSAPMIVYSYIDYILLAISTCSFLTVNIRII